MEGLGDLVEQAMDEQQRTAQLQQKLVSRVGSMIVDAETRALSAESERDFYRDRCSLLEAELAMTRGQLEERDLAAQERADAP